MTIAEHFKQLREGLPPPATAGYFGSQLSPEQAQIILLPVAFDATTSYRRGAHRTPEMMRQPSHQLDLFDLSFGSVFRSGIASFLEESYLQQVARLNDRAGLHAEKVISDLDMGQAPDPYDLDIVNQASSELNEAVAKASKKILAARKLCGVVGGDHSVPFGFLRSLAAEHESFAILHIDAHHDLRAAYEGFQHSHASIMYNVLEQIPQVSHLLSIGIRDFSEDERLYAQAHPKVETLYDEQIFSELAAGQSFAQIVDARLQSLPEKVYLSFDIDGLDPSLCPGTGTPVPGGLSYAQAIWILQRLADHGKQLIGFDLCEVNGKSDNEDDDWDFNVGARILYKLCGLLSRSHQLQPLA